MAIDELDEFLRREGVLISAGGAEAAAEEDPAMDAAEPSTDELKPPTEKLDLQDMTELIKILNVAVKVHSPNYQPSTPMIEAFFNKVMDGFSVYGDLPPPPGGFPIIDEVYEYTEDPDDMRASEIPPWARPFELVLQINIMTTETRFFARTDGEGDGEVKELPVKWQTFGGERMARLQSAVLRDILDAFEEHNAGRAVQHARRYMHQRWASLERNAHRGLRYDFVPVQAIFDQMPQLMMGHEEVAPRFWFTDAEKVDKK